MRRQRDDTSVQFSATDVVSNLGPPGERSEDAPFVGNPTTAVGDKPNELEHLGPPGERSEDAPFVGNLTIAVGDKASELERAGDGIEVFTLLDIWASPCGL